MISTKEIFSQESVAKVIYAYIAAQLGLSVIPDDADIQVAIAKIEERLVAIDKRLERIEKQP